MGSLKIIIITLIFSLTYCVYDITQFGAIPNSDTVTDQFINQRAILAAISAANSSNGERVIKIPSKKFYSMPIRIENAHNITF